MISHQNILNTILQMANKKSVVICIEGDAAAGKTTNAFWLSHFLENKGFSVSIIHMDDFFLPFDMKTSKRLSIPGENIHHERFLKEVAPTLCSKKKLSNYGKFDCSIGKISTYTRLYKSDIYIVEGSYSMNKNLLGLYDLKIFMKIDAKTQIERIQKRNTPEIAQRYKKEWIPMEKEFHKAFKLEQIADFVF